MCLGNFRILEIRLGGPDLLGNKYNYFQKIQSIICNQLRLLQQLIQNRREKSQKGVLITLSATRYELKYWNYFVYNSSTERNYVEVSVWTNFHI
jgi:hypothetical protein